MTTHTPGPWRVGDAGATVFGPKTDSPSPKQIASVSVYAVVGEENKANARLIAAAPELLEALAYFVHRWDGVSEADILLTYSDPEFGKRLTDARSLLNQAEGKNYSK